MDIGITKGRGICGCVYLRNEMSHQHSARQHKLAEVACYRLERTLAGVLPCYIRKGGGRACPSVCPLSLSFIEKTAWIRKEDVVVVVVVVVPQHYGLRGGGAAGGGGRGGQGGRTAVPTQRRTRISRKAPVITMSHRNVSPARQHIQWH